MKTVKFRGFLVYFIISKIHSAASRLIYYFQIQEETFSSVHSTTQTLMTSTVWDRGELCVPIWIVFVNFLMVFILLLGHFGWFIWWRKNARRLRRCEPAAVATNRRATLVRLNHNEVNLQKAEYVYCDLAERKKIGNVNFDLSAIESTDRPEVVGLQRKKRPVVSMPTVVHFTASSDNGFIQRSHTSLPTNSLELLPVNY